MKATPTRTGSSLCFLLLLFIAGWLVFPSCENDIKTISTLFSADTLPTETATDIELIYSDSANVLVFLKSPLLERYGGKEPYLNFPRGLELTFYEKDLVKTSFLSCRKAVVWERTKIMEAREKVEVRGIKKQEKLNTEHLIWDERQGKIYSNEYVKITTLDKVLYGQGFESDQGFENWIIKRPTGSFSIENE